MTNTSPLAHAGFVGGKVGADYRTPDTSTWAFDADPPSGEVLAGGRVFYFLDLFSATVTDTNIRIDILSDFLIPGGAAFEGAHFFDVGNSVPGISGFTLAGFDVAGFSDALVNLQGADEIFLNFAGLEFVAGQYISLNLSFDGGAAVPEPTTLVLPGPSPLASTPMASAVGKVTYIVGSSTTTTTTTSNIGVYNARRTGVVSGYLCPQYCFGDLTEIEREWRNAILFRGNPEYCPSKSNLLFNPKEESYTPGISPMVGLFGDLRVKYIYTTTLLDVVRKLLPLGGIVEVNAGNTMFTFRPSLEVLTSNYQDLFLRSSSIRYLGPEYPIYSMLQFAPNFGDILAGDFLMFQYCTETVLGVYWVTSNYKVLGQPFVPVRDSDPIDIIKTGMMTLGLAPTGSPIYLTMGDPGPYTFDGNVNFPNDLSGTTFNETIQL